MKLTGCVKLLVSESGDLSSFHNYGNFTPSILVQFMYLIKRRTSDPIPLRCSVIK